MQKLSAIGKCAARRQSGIQRTAGIGNNFLYQKKPPAGYACGLWVAEYDNLMSFYSREDINDRIRKRAVLKCS